MLIISALHPRVGSMILSQDSLLASLFLPFVIRLFSALTNCTIYPFNPRSLPLTHREGFPLYIIWLLSPTAEQWQIGYRNLRAFSLCMNFSNCLEYIKKLSEENYHRLIRKIISPVKLRCPLLYLTPSHSFSLTYIGVGMCRPSILHHADSRLTPRDYISIYPHWSLYPPWKWYMQVTTC